MPRSGSTNYMQRYPPVRAVSVASAGAHLSLNPRLIIADQYRRWMSVQAQVLNLMQELKSAWA
jgi:ABC-type antimicrobial peptide transport system ATPase subunit